MCFPESEGVIIKNDNYLIALSKLAIPGLQEPKEQVSDRPLPEFYSQKRDFQGQFQSVAPLKGFQKHKLETSEFTHLIKLELSTLICHIFDTPLGIG